MTQTEQITCTPSLLSPAAQSSQTKIVATIGPACRTDAMLSELIQAGVEVFRINTAHGSREDHQWALDAVRRVSEQTSQVAAVLVDLGGPKIRLGELPDGKYECVRGEKITFLDADVTKAGNPGEFTVTYEHLVDELQPGNRIMLADGTVALEVEDVLSDRAICRILQSGTVRNRQGVNLPGVKLSVPAMTREDRDNARWAARAGADFISLSFVRHADDITRLRELVVREKSSSKIVAKIEKPEALEHLESIVRAADAVMVARGDLGVEVDIARLPVIQKQIISMCNKMRRPVIVATQMLDSMQHSRIPTRAEVNDVATAILDGADACMLSGETAVGQYPRESVDMMRRIALSIEKEFELCTERLAASPSGVSSDVSPITEATAWHAGQLAHQLGAKLMVVVTNSGRAALSLSNCRLRVPTIGLSELDSVLRQLSLYWGVVPTRAPENMTPEQVLKWVIERGQAEGRLHSGDRIVVLGGTGLKSSRHNAVVVHEIE